MSKQVRIACDVLDLLQQPGVVTVGAALESVVCDEKTLRQTLRVLTERGYAVMVGLATDGRTKQYVAGPKLGGTQ